MIDQTRDPGYSYLQVVVERFPEVREMAKTASMEPESFDALPSTAFAWPEKRMFPIHNREHTALSVGYAKVASETLPKYVAMTLRDAAELYDIPAEAYAGQVKEAAEPTYLLPDKKRFAIRTAEDVKEAESAYRYKYAKMSIDDRFEVGYRLLKVAGDYGVALDPSTEKLAGFTVTSTRALRDSLRARAVAATKVASPIAAVFDKLAEEFTDVEPYLDDLSDQLKLARCIGGLDNQANITDFYGKKLADPMRTVFNTEKRASAFVKVAGALQDKALLHKLPLTFWQDALGDDIAQEIAPGGVVDTAILEQIIPTLPADMKATLERQLAAYSSR